MKVDIKDISIEYTVEHRRVRYARMQIKDGKLFIVAPMRFTGTGEFIEKCKGWIYKRVKAIDRAKEESKALELAGISRDEFEGLVKISAEKYCARLGVRYNRIKIRDLRSKWGSCSGRGNISINGLLRFMPPDYTDFIVHHELLHINFKRHDRKFYGEVEKEFPEMKQLEKGLKLYWLALRDKVDNLQAV
jgi:predicted metal-dependent hydrolase